MQTKDWFLSKTLWGAVLLILTTALRGAGIEIEDLNERVVEALVNGIGLVLVIVIVGRFTAKTKLTAGGGNDALLALIAAVSILSLTACEGVKFAGGIQTDYGSVISDGKTMTTLLDARKKEKTSNVQLLTSNTEGEEQPQPPKPRPNAHCRPGTRCGPALAPATNH